MVKADIVVQDMKTVFVAWSNTDLTEGRGEKIPLYVCELETTAKRLGRKLSVQGSDCNVTEELAVKVSGKWLAPAKIEYPSIEDRNFDLKIKRKKEVLKKAKELGLTDDEIMIIVTGI